MWQTIIGAGVTLIALVVGALLEPLKSRFSHGARMRQIRAERCEEFVTAVMGMHNFMTTARATASGEFRPVYSLESPDDTRTLLDEFNSRWDKLQELAGHITLYGPDELASAANAVVDTVSAVPESAGDEMDQASVDLNKAVEAAAKELSTALRTFVKLARKHLR